MYPRKSDFRLSGISLKMGSILELNKVFFSFFCQIFGVIFDDVLKFCSAFGALHFVKNFKYAVPKI